MAAFRTRPPSDEAAKVTATAAELLWGRAPTAPASASQVRVLLVLEQHDGINLRTLAGSLGTAPPSASRLCDRLEISGLLERAPGSADRREVRLRLSGRGRSYLAALRARRAGQVLAVLAAMPSAKRDALLEGLHAFCTAAAPRILDITVRAEGSTPDPKPAATEATRREDTRPENPRG